MDRFFLEMKLFLLFIIVLYSSCEGSTSDEDIISGVLDDQDADTESQKKHGNQDCKTLIMPPYENQGLSNFMEKMWGLDENRLVEGEDYALHIGGRTRYSFDGPDEAEDPLFTWVRKEVFQRPTYKAFVALLDNYESDTGVPEIVTDKELAENQHFIDLVFKSKPMQLAYRFLKYKGKASDDEQTFRRKFYNMWFKLYRRTRGSRSLDSSGFEHVFVGETRGEKEVIGFHNWIQFYLQEKAKKVDYKGFMSSAKNPHLLTVQFSWQGEVKPKGSMMIGISPEFEIAMCTVCYLMGHDSYKFAFDGDEIVIKVHQMAGKIGSCYPQLPPKTKLVRKSCS